MKILDKKFYIQNKITHTTQCLTLREILDEINRDRSDEWQPYNVDDWVEGLEEFTEYRLVKAKDEVV